MSSNALIPALSSNPAFTQQGQADWVAFGNTVWQASADIQKQFASANAQPVTFAAGLALANQFSLSTKGQQRMEDAIASLHCSSAFGEVMWFGFGVRSLLYIMSNIVGGIKCVSLCSCLVDTHSKTFAATILADLWDLSCYPEESKLSRAQFIALISPYSGGVVQSTFTRTLDVMLGKYLGNSRALKVFSIYLEEKSIVFSSLEATFIATLAYWLFDLRTHVEDEEENLIFTSTPLHETIQLHVRYGLVKEDPIRIYDQITRVPWDSCLQRSFGPDFQKLLELSSVLGSYLGSVARVYAAIALDELEACASEYCRSNLTLSEMSYGYGLTNTILKTFPELESLETFRDDMEGAAQASVNDAILEISRCFGIFKGRCACRFGSTFPQFFIALAG
ncbi:MAG: hypothetical protein MMC33_003458 [Icmadophila ericetorum]|nr:hypothetical protein [Icmadophila ericetorum]